jgi:ATP-binding cassette, subfamily B, multidrug efflux pump
MGFWGHGFDLAAANKKGFDTQLLLRTLRYMLPYRLALAASIASVLVVTACDLARPYLVSVIIDRDIPTGVAANLFPTLALYAGTLVLGMGAMVGQRLVTGWIGLKVIWDLRDGAFRHLQTLSLRFYDNREMGDTISRMTNDIDLLNELISNGLVTLVNTLFALGGAALAMLALDVRLSIVTLAVMPLVLFITVVFRGWIGEAYRGMRQEIAKVTTHVEEGIAGVRIIQSFAQEERNIGRFRAVNEANRLVAMEAAGLRSVYFPSIDLVSSVGIAVVLWFGGIAALRGDLTFGVMVAFLLYLFRFFQPIRNLTMLYDQVLAAMAASERVFELLDTEPDIRDPDAPIHLPRIEGHVEYQHVHFRYIEDDPVLVDVSLHAEPAEMIAIVGATGSGKSTIISLLSRLYDVDEGHILIDGHDLREIAIHSLRTQLGVVLQEGFLFSNTIRENIRYGRLDATDEEVEEAAKAVGAHEFIMRMPDGYDTEVRERGEKLSMGERQLICLARALIADPRILILDEATSSIDPYTELIIQDALFKLFQGRTSIVIAHRLSTVRRADRIYVLDHGVIQEVGSHDELLAKGGLYANLYELQFKAQEEMAAENDTASAG